MTKVRVNLINGQWWLQPSIWTMSKSRWHSRVYPNLRKLLAVEKLTDQDVVFSINKDKDLTVFRMLQQWKDLKCFLNAAEKAVIEEQGYIDVKIPRKKLVIRYDAKSLRLLRAGYLPYISSAFLWEERNKNIRPDYFVYVWRKDGFEDISLETERDNSLRIQKENAIGSQTEETKDSAATIPSDS